MVEGSVYEEVFIFVMYLENDISNFIKNGIFYLEDFVNYVRVRLGWVVVGKVVRGFCLSVSFWFFLGVVFLLFCFD